MSEWPWPAPIDDRAADHLRPGTMLPDIALVSTLGGMVSLRQHAGRAVIFIYPWTGGPGLANPPGWDHVPGAHGSTPEALGFRDLAASFGELGVAIFGLSAQSPAAELEFAERHALPFALLSDIDFELARALRLPRFATGGVDYLRRLTLIAKDGMIERTIYPVHPPDSHAAAVLAIIGRHQGSI